MDDMKLLVKILVAVKACQDEDVFNVNLVDEKVLKATSKQRDRVAVQLQKEGYIEGLYVIDGIDNCPVPCVLWGNSHPVLTIKGMEYVHSDSTFKSVAKELAGSAIGAATQIATNVLSGMI